MTTTDWLGLGIVIVICLGILAFVVLFVCWRIEARLKRLERKDK